VVGARDGARLGVAEVGDKVGATEGGREGEGARVGELKAQGMEG